MLFNSYIFIFLFLPLTVAGYYLLKDRYAVAAKLWLTGMSLWFYGYFNTGYLLIMVFSIVFNYLMFRLLLRETHYKKALLTLGVAGNTGLLIYFKYTDFLIESINTVFGTDHVLPGILLPLGISFFTFQQIGFLADTYRGEITKCDPVDYCLFVSFFPQLVAGPIVGHDMMLPQYENIGKVKGCDPEKILRGIVLFIFGLSKKVLIADALAGAVDGTYLSLISGVSRADACLTVLLYSLQLYFDFSGYCDMALGLGHILGIDIPVNFDSPYKSANIIEFWRRWHITLGRFFMKNVYIPLGGNRKGEIRTYVNLMIVFLLSGIWHGAGVTFILWGLMHGIMYLIVRFCKKSLHIDCEGVISRIITFIYVCIAWVFFRADSIKDALLLLKSTVINDMTKVSDAFLATFNKGEIWYVLKALHLTSLPFGRYLVPILYTVGAVVLVFAAPNSTNVSEKMKLTPAKGAALGVLAVWSILSLSGVSTFLYFNF